MNHFQNQKTKFVEYIAAAAGIVVCFVLSPFSDP